MIDDPKLYEKIKQKLKKDPKIVWPSAYASGMLVKQYKNAGGTYSGPRPVKKGISRWFKEKWVDVCTKDLKPCGRTNHRKYPKCRPLIRITKETPMTVGELTKKYGKPYLKILCVDKRKHGLPTKDGKPILRKLLKKT